MRRAANAGARRLRNSAQRIGQHFEFFAARAVGSPHQRDFAAGMFGIERARLHISAIQQALLSPPFRG